MKRWREGERQWRDEGRKGTELGEERGMQERVMEEREGGREGGGDDRDANETLLKGGFQLSRSSPPGRKGSPSRLEGQ